MSKPAGLDFHSQGSEPGFHRQLSLQLGLELYPVHRLDKATSGLLLFAKHQQACRELVDLFTQREIEKFYLAIVSNKIKKKQGKIVGDMVKARNGSYKLTKGTMNPAVTQFMSCTLKPGYRLAVMKPKTGKTHQLRVAMKSLGAAIVGDERYAGEVADRLYLHAFAIRFLWQNEVFQFSHLPDTGEAFTDDCFDRALAAYRSPWELDWPK